MILVFTLSMPGCNSWNGRWSGEGRCYAITRNFTGKKGEEKGRTIATTGYYHYSFGDGWAAGITVEHVTPAEARKARAKSVGFCGYDWMVDSIIRHGKILNSLQEKDLLAATVKV